MKKNYSSKSAKSWFIVSMLVFIFFIPSILKANDTKKQSIAIINIDSQGLSIKMPLMTSLVTLEMEKIDIYEVIDKYDVANHMERYQISTTQTYGKTDLIRIGDSLNVDKVLSGSVEKFGNKIIVVLRVVGVESKSIEKIDVMEYIDQEEDIQQMIRISLHNLFEIENDKNTVDMLSNFNPPLANSRSKVNLSGPRFGATMTLGKAGQRLMDSKSNGGFDMFPVSSMIGYQFEIQFVSAGEFQALFEFVGALNALESGNIIPSLSVLTGFRFNKLGFELGLGPVIRGVQMAEGYYDENDKWNIKTPDTPEDLDYIWQIDNRGSYSVSTGLIIAAGFTLKSGYINFPITAYVSPRKDATVVGLVFGFNVAKKK